MARAFGGPLKYIQRNGEIARLNQHIACLGSKYLVLMDKAVFEKLSPIIESTIAPRSVLVFQGECCAEEIMRVKTAIHEHAIDVVIGVGGGKTIDTAKIAATDCQARIVIVPTIAATDAPCSAVAVRYTKEGVYEESLRLSQNPDIVIVDPEVIIAAPVRFLISGIGDALSTWFEARSNIESRTPNYVAGGFPPTDAGIAIARSCHEILMQEALKAKIAAENGLITSSVDRIIEANILLSGLGFENCGCSAAHGIHDGLTVLKETHKFTHGEKVAFGTLCLLMLENRDIAEIKAMILFCKSLGLPTTLADLNLQNATHDDLTRVAEAALAEGECTFACPVELTVPLVRDSILALDAFSKSLILE